MSCPNRAAEPKTCSFVPFFRAIDRRSTRRLGSGKACFSLFSGVPFNVPFSEHDVGFLPTSRVVSFPDCPKSTFYGTLEHASRMGPFTACPTKPMGNRDSTCELLTEATESPPASFSGRLLACAEVKGLDSPFVCIAFSDRLIASAACFTTTLRHALISYRRTPR
jgi:hypothetical protein